MRKDDSMGQVFAKCPFYLRDSRKSITCEGLAADTVMRTVFEEEGRKQAYLTQECYRMPRQNHCPYCRVLEQKYCGEQ